MISGWTPESWVRTLSRGFLGFYTWGPDRENSAETTNALMWTFAFTHKTPAESESGGSLEFSESLKAALDSPTLFPSAPCHPSVKEYSTWGPPMTTSSKLSRRWSRTRCPHHPSTPAPFAMDVSKPSDLAVLTGCYFRRGMAKPSATRNGHRKKRDC